MLRDGSTLRLRVPTAADEATSDRLLPRPSRPTAATSASTARRSIDHATVAGALETDWQHARLAARRARRPRRASCAPSRSRPMSVCMTRAGPRSLSPSQTTCTAVGSELACSSGSQRTRRRAGIEEFVAEVLPQNDAMLGVFDDAGFETARTLQDGVVEVTLRLASPGSTVAERRDRARSRRGRCFTAPVLPARARSP